LRQRYRAGQEDQLGALSLVLNAVVLWNTFYMDLAVKQLRTDGYPVHDEDVARLSPLGFKHIHFYLDISGTWAHSTEDPNLEVVGSWVRRGRRATHIAVR